MFLQILAQIERAKALLDAVKADAPDYLDKAAEASEAIGQVLKDAANYLRQPKAVSAAAPGGDDHRAKLEACRDHCEDLAERTDDDCQEGLARLLAGCCDKLAGQAA